MTVHTDGVTTIVAHHAELLMALTARVDAVVAAARDDRPHQPACAGLRTFLESDLVPHARAEEEVLYAAATDPTLRPLVTGMIFEHETLLGLAAELDHPSSAVDAAGTARAIKEVFAGHVRRENELLLPALAADPTVDLPALLPVMERRFTAYRSASIP
ncbi:MAG: hemerythrin domain-containing protein [Actinomycetota bacterium]